MTPPLAVFRADASPALGGGHVARCTALARELAGHGWRVAFAASPDTLAVYPALARTGFAVDILDTAPEDEPRALTERFPDGCSLLVVDHYGRDARFESRCRPWTSRIMAFDDFSDREHDADLIVDPTPGCTACERRTPRPRSTALVVGPAYAPLEPRLRDLRTHRPINKKARRLHIGFGTADPANGTTLALEAVSALDDFDTIDVVLGPMAPHRCAVEKRIDRLSPRARLHLDPPNLPTLLQKADLAVGGGGVSALERCCLGVPSLIVAIADNQAAAARGLAAHGAARLAGAIDRLECERLADEIRSLARDPSRRHALARQGMALCDGLGTARLRLWSEPPVMASNGGRIELRPAERNDAEIMLRWQSEPGQRRFSRTPGPPRAETHQHWLDTKLSDPDCIFHVILCAGAPAGLVRLERDPAAESHEVSILIAHDYQGRKIGVGALALIRRLLPCAEFVAEIHPENTASLALFRKAGYRLEKGIYRNAPDSRAERFG